MKNMKGITLIALVITIVILIILAGVAISLSLGENGIFNKAKFATEEYANEQEKEKKEIGELANEIDVETIGSTRNTQTVEKITFSNILAGYSIIDNESVKIGDMVYLNFKIKKTSQWVAGWTKNLATISIPPKRSFYVDPVNTYKGVSDGQLFINTTGTVDLYVVYNTAWGTNSAMVVNGFYYVGE